MNRAATKTERIHQLEALLLAHPEGMSQAEIARCQGVHRSTVLRMLPDLPHWFTEADGRILIDRSAYLVNVRFNLHEALAVHLAARLLATRLDRHNPHAASALRKLSVALERLAPQISRHLSQSADAMDESGRSDPNYLRSLETLTLAWGLGRKVRVWHRKDRQEPVKEYTFSPYYIEPNAIGQSTYAIGLREPPCEMRTFKIERIERVELLQEAYAIPANFDPTELLSSAWGIWYTEAEPVEVTLRFSQRAASRVAETRWHRSEQVSELDDGSLLWRACVAEPQEMMPWIRGWGADVEVLGPDRLRTQIRQEMCATAKLYGWNICEEE
jgi:CRISPR-associated endonuclease/helicase Cas3